MGKITTKRNESVRFGTPFGKDIKKVCTEKANLNDEILKRDMVIKDGGDTGTTRHIKRKGNTILRPDHQGD